MEATVRHIHTHHFEDAIIRDLLASIRNLADNYAALRKNQEAMMSKLDDLIKQSSSVLDDVTKESDASDAIMKVVQHQNDTIAAIKQQLADAIDQNDPSKLQVLQDNLDKIQQTNMANAKKVADAVTAGTPVESNSSSGGSSTSGASSSSSAGSTDTSSVSGTQSPAPSPASAPADQTAPVNQTAPADQTAPATPTVPPVNQFTPSNQ